MSLSSRGLGFARMEPNIREAFGGMTQDTYHAQHNPNGIINMGIAENVGQRRHEMQSQSTLTCLSVDSTR